MTKQSSAEMTGLPVTDDNSLIQVGPGIQGPRSSSAAVPGLAE